VNSAENIVIELADVPLTGSPAAPPADWRVRRGDYWVLGGLPGMGKSGLLALAAGLERAVDGRQFFFGEDLAALNEAGFVSLRRRIGLVFGEGGRLFGRLTVAENVSLPLCYHRDCSPGEVAPEVEALLAGMELLPHAHQSVARLSRSWRQRAGLARALALQPEVLLLDNPLAGLDPRQTRWWVDYLHGLNEARQTTLIVATDDLRPWAEQGRQFALLNDDGFQVLGGREKLAASAAPLLRDMLAATKD